MASARHMDLAPTEERASYALLAQKAMGFGTLEKLARDASKEGGSLSPTELQEMVKAGIGSMGVVAALVMSIVKVHDEVAMKATPDDWLDCSTFKYEIFSGIFARTIDCQEIHLYLSSCAFTFAMLTVLVSTNSYGFLCLLSSNSVCAFREKFPGAVVYPTLLLFLALCCFLADTVFYSATIFGFQRVGPYAGCACLACCAVFLTYWSMNKFVKKHASGVAP
ncbi:unnamed protein product [Polarella glacialis]|uniref:Uncharacterized protein n=1 Tax=Polarella glacialis TaxID=89957 RepID=A0A813E7D4_POLGL|nr:unnamed protein product [Polarella glacialis]